MLVAYDSSTNREVKDGDIVRNRYFEEAKFVCATRAQTNSKSGKVVVRWSEQGQQQEYYDKVFNLHVKEV